MHRVTEVDPEARTGQCAKCGPTSVRPLDDDPDRLRAAIAYLEAHRVGGFAPQ